MNNHKEKDPSGHEKKHLNFKINGKMFKFLEQYITGSEIKKMGSISSEDELYLAIKKPWEDELITNETTVDLARPGIEHFFSKIKLPLIIIVNGKEKSWNEESISFEQVVKLAFASYVDNGNTSYTVTYDRGPHQNPQGIMVKGDSVFVKHKMIFNVTATNKS